MVLLLAAAVVLGWQRPPLACPPGDSGCCDHAAIVACAAICPLPVLPQPTAAPTPGTIPLMVSYSFERPILHGRPVAPDAGPPRRRS